MNVVLSGGGAMSGRMSWNGDDGPKSLRTTGLSEEMPSLNNKKVPLKFLNE